MIEGNSIEVKSVDEALAVTINTIIKKGDQVYDDKSTRGNFTELRNHIFTLTDPQNRISFNPKRPLDPITGIARFVWLISGSDRLEDIAFYQDQVRFYTDNGLSIPGSNYGKRLFEPQPGVDQIKAVIDMLKANPSSRRACASIWQPNDVTRINSKDLPCALILGFQIRGNELFTTLVMRSNNACILLHVNLFEFTLLGEIVATELGVKYGGHIHDSFSMHIFEKDKELALEILDSFNEIEMNETFSMPPMPINPSPLEQSKILARLEAELRNKNVFKEIANLESHLENAQRQLHPYWFSFFKVLTIGALVNAERFDKAMTLAASLPPYFKKLVISRLQALQEKTVSKNLTMDVFVKKPSKYEYLKDVFALSTSERKLVEKHVKSHCEDWNKHNKKKLTIELQQRVVEIILQNVTVAARSSFRPQTNVVDSSFDYLKISKEEVFSTIRKIFNDYNNSKLT